MLKYSLYLVISIHWHADMANFHFPLLPGYILDTIRKEGFQQPTVIQAQVLLDIHILR